VDIHETLRLNSLFPLSAMKTNVCSLNLPALISWVLEKEQDNCRGFRRVTWDPPQVTHTTPNKRL
jgi:hypothetical protein